MKKKSTPFAKVHQKKARAEKVKAEKPEPKARAKRPRTAMLPGMADEKIEAIRTAAYRFLDAAEGVANEKEKLSDAKDVLVTVMHEHEITRYYDPESELLVTLTEAEEKVKVLKGESALSKAGTSAPMLPADDPENYKGGGVKVTVGGGDGDAPEPE